MSVYYFFSVFNLFFHGFVYISFDKLILLLDSLFKRTYSSCDRGTLQIKVLTTSLYRCRVLFCGEQGQRGMIVDVNYLGKIVSFL